MVVVHWLTTRPLRNRVVLPSDWPQIEDSAKKAVKEKQPFERVVMPKEALLEMFAVSGSKAVVYVTSEVVD